MAAYVRYDENMNSLEAVTWKRQAGKAGKDGEAPMQISIRKRQTDEILTLKRSLEGLGMVPISLCFIDLEKTYTYLAGDMDVLRTYGLDGSRLRHCQVVARGLQKLSSDQRAESKNFGVDGGARCRLSC